MKKTKQLTDEQKLNRVTAIVKQYSKSDLFRRGHHHFNTELQKEGKQPISTEKYKEDLIKKLTKDRKTEFVTGIKEDKKSKWTKKSISYDLKKLLVTTHANIGIKNYASDLLKGKERIDGSDEFKISVGEGKYRSKVTGEIKDKTLQYSKEYNKINSYLTRVYSKNGLQKGDGNRLYIAELIKQKGEIKGGQGSRTKIITVELPKYNDLGKVKTRGGKSPVVYSKLEIIIDFNEKGKGFDDAGFQVILYDKFGNKVV